MNYQLHYERLIEKARTRRVPNSYTELHHIIPVSIGGSDAFENLVLLTAREHFVAHLLLFKINPSHKGLAYAAYRMSNRYLYRSSRIYDSLRTAHLKICKEIGNSHKVNGTGIFAKGMQAKGGEASSRLAVTNKIGIHSDKYHGVGGKVGGKLPWWYNPETGKTARSKTQPAGYEPGRGNSIAHIANKLKENQSGIYNADIRIRASKLGAKANVAKNKELGNGIFKIVTCQCGKTFNPGNLVLHQRATGCKGVRE